MSTTGFGHGKVILLGEHAVVYGQPAIVTALSRGVTARALLSERSGVRLFLDGANEPTRAGDGSIVGTALAAMLEGFSGGLPGADLHIDSGLSIGVGLGSSAALSVAIARVLLQLSGQNEDVAAVEELAGAAESVFHQRPSGVDVAGAARGSTLLFSRGADPRPCPVVGDLELVIARVQDAPPTSEVVAAVRSRRDAEPASYDESFRAIGDLVDSGIKALESGDMQTLAGLFDKNQELLRRIGVSTRGLDTACEIAKDAGALGAKLTGAGGGGCIIALAAGNGDSIVRALRSMCGPVFTHSCLD